MQMRYIFDGINRYDVPCLQWVSDHLFKKTPKKKTKKNLFTNFFISKLVKNILNYYDLED